MGRTWSVLFIGGASATGKSTLAEKLGAHFRLPVVDSDLFWLVLRRMIPESLEPVLHVFHGEETWSQPVEVLVEQYLEVSQLICKAVEILVWHYHRTRDGAVIEGTWLLPSFCAQASFDGHAVPTHSLFLYEPSRKALEGRLAGRPDGWFHSQPQALQERQLEMHYAYNVEIRRSAAALGLRCLESEPFETLLDRALETLGRGPHPVA